MRFGMRAANPRARTPRTSEYGRHLGDEASCIGISGTCPVMLPSKSNGTMQAAHSYSPVRIARAASRVGASGWAMSRRKGVRHSIEQAVLEHYSAARRYDSKRRRISSASLSVRLPETRANAFRAVVAARSNWPAAACAEAKVLRMGALRCWVSSEARSAN